MATVLRTWLLVLLLVHHATSTFDALGCIKGFSCFKNLKPKKVRFENIIERDFEGYELIGFMPTDVAQEDWSYWWSSILGHPLGDDGAHLFETYEVARDKVELLIRDFKETPVKPKVCSVFARKDKLESWQWIYVPPNVEVYNFKYGYSQPSSLYRSPNNLKTYMELLKSSGKAHSGVLVTDWSASIRTVYKGYLMKIPRSYFDDTIFYCHGLSDDLHPKYLKMLDTNLNWKEKFGSVWKLENYPTPMAITAKERLQDGTMIWSPRWNTGTSARQDGEGSTVDNDNLGSSSDIKLAPAAREEEKETIETPE